MISHLCFQQKTGFSEKQLKHHDAQAAEDDDKGEADLFNSVNPHASYEEIFAPVKRLWNSPAEQHREVKIDLSEDAERQRDRETERLLVCVTLMTVI